MCHHGSTCVCARCTHMCMCVHVCVHAPWGLKWKSSIFLNHSSPYIWRQTWPRGPISASLSSGMTGSSHTFLAWLLGYLNSSSHLSGANAFSSEPPPQPFWSFLTPGSWLPVLTRGIVLLVNTSIIHMVLSSDRSRSGRHGIEASLQHWAQSA